MDIAYRILQLVLTRFLFFRLNGRARYEQNSVILPALRPAGSGNVAERRRGQQAVLRGRGKRDMNC